jgi:ribosomal protein S18 acetylase RimI-like enzyme
MGRQTVRVRSSSFPDIALRCIGPGDLENMRRWKNANRSSFFHQAEISVDQQERWYHDYCLREDDYMFVVEEKAPEGFRPVGCVGFRILADCVDIYNIMRGEARSNAHARLGDAVVLMCSYIQSICEKQITCKVLSNNPAVGWYVSLGFSIRNEQDNYYNVDLDSGGFRPCAIECD